jgi:hypothetical protein
MIFAQNFDCPGRRKSRLVYLWGFNRRFSIPFSLMHRKNDDFGTRTWLVEEVYGRERELMDKVTPSPKTGS